MRTHPGSWRSLLLLAPSSTTSVSSATASVSISNAPSSSVWSTAAYSSISILEGAGTWEATMPMGDAEGNDGDTSKDINRDLLWNPAGRGTSLSEHIAMSPRADTQSSKSGSKIPTRASTPEMQQHETTRRRKRVRISWEIHWVCACHSSPTLRRLSENTPQLTRFIL